MITLKGDIRWKENDTRAATTHPSVRYRTEHALPVNNAENTPTKRATYLRHVEGYLSTTYNNPKITKITIINENKLMIKKKRSFTLYFV